MASEERQSRWCDLGGPVVVAILTLIAVLLTLDAAGDYPKLFEGPGVTLDESFNVQMGVYQWNALREYNVALLHPDSVREVFGPESNYNPDHPPLGRVWLGIWHDLTKWLFPPSDHASPFVTDCARVGSATAFALTVFLIGVFATQWYGRAAGIVSAVSLPLMPRLFAHAHLASLETFMNLTYAATILAVAHWWLPRGSPALRNFGIGRLSPDDPGGLRSANSEIPECLTPVIAALTGVLFGLALLSKMQAILIPPVVGMWAVSRWRQRAIVPLLIFGVIGFVVFFFGWPWLWLDPAKHLREYFARTTGRAVLHCYYLGRVWLDREVPWHYPFVMFAVTVPIGLHVLALLSLWGEGGMVHCGIAADHSGHKGLGFKFWGLLSCTRRAWRQPREQLLLVAAVLPLVLFALPGVAVYDGERLFLITYPLWAIFIGRGASIALSWMVRQASSERLRLLANPRIRVAMAGLFLAFQAVGLLATHPCQLSYYNILVGGSRGAERLGFERTYWGDSLTRSFLRQVVSAVPAEATISVAPVLHQFQLEELLNQSPILRAHGIRLVAASAVRDRSSVPIEGELRFRRKADLVASDGEFPVLTSDDVPHVGDGQYWLAVLQRMPIKKKPDDTDRTD